MLSFGSGISWKRESLVDNHLKWYFSGKMHEVITTGEKRQNDIFNCSVDTRLIKKTFTWSAKFSLKQGLSDLLLCL